MIIEAYLIGEGEQEGGAGEVAHEEVVEATGGRGGRIEGKDDGEGKRGEDRIAVRFEEWMPRDRQRIDVVLAERSVKRKNK
jgi:hypothetical protein